MIWFDGKYLREKISMKLCLIDTFTSFMISRPIFCEPLPTMRTLKNGTTSYNFLFVVVGNVMELGKHFIVEVHFVTGGDGQNHMSG